MNWRGWLDRVLPKVKRAPRYTNSGIVAYYWDGGAPRQNPVKDISLTGAYVSTPDKWGVGTIIWIALQQSVSQGKSSSPIASITLPCKVVWDGPDGFGVNFVLTDEKERRALKRFIREAVARQQTRMKTTSRGQASMESKS